MSKDKEMLEGEVSQLVLLESSKQGNSLWRNNSGAFEDKTGRLVRYGLGNDGTKASKLMKSSDFIGITPTVITPEMVGQTVAIFTAVEMKRPDWQYKSTEREVAQKKYIDFVISRGGIAGFCNSIDSYKILMKK